MKRIKPILAVLLFCSCGCASVMRAFVPDSPRPNKEQLEAAKTISEKTVPVIVGAQTDKQSKIRQIANASFVAIAKTSDKSQVEGIMNVARDAIEAVKDADGTAKIIGNMQGDTLEGILRMNTMQYMAGIAAQTYANVGNIEKTKGLAKLGWQWSADKIAAAAGGLGTLLLGMGGGLLHFVRTASKRKSFLHADAKVDDRKLLFPFEAILEQKTKKIAIFLILSAKLNTKEERK